MLAQRFRTFLAYARGKKLFLKGERKQNVSKVGLEGRPEDPRPPQNPPHPGVRPPSQNGFF